MSDGITEMHFDQQVMAEHDPVESPMHYNQGGIECVDAIEAAITGLPSREAYHTASALKYLWRWYWKGKYESLRKARWHINRLLGDS